MPQCLKCALDRRAGEPRCEGCGFPFSCFSEGQLIKPGNFLLQSAVAGGEFEIVWQAEARGPGPARPVEFHEVAPPSGDSAKFRPVYREWSQACRNCAGVLPELLTILSEKNHYCAVWGAEPLPTLEDLAQGHALSPVRLEALWNSALSGLKLLQAAAFDFCHGAIRPATLRVAQAAQETIRFGPPSLAAYAGMRAGEAPRGIDLQLLAAAFRLAGEPMAGATGPQDDADRWIAGPVQASLQWVGGRECEPATNAGAVLQFSEIVARAYKMERRGVRDQARSEYAKAASIALPPYLREAIRRSEAADGSPVPAPPRFRPATGAFAAPAPPPPERPTVPQPVPPPVPPPPPPAAAIESDSAVVQFAKTDPIVESASAAPEPATPRAGVQEIAAAAEVTERPIEAVTLPATLCAPVPHEPAVVETLEPPPASGDPRETVVEESAASQAPAPPARKIVVPAARGPKTRSGITTANRPVIAKQPAGAGSKRLWIAISAAAIVPALGIAFWLHPNSILNDALDLIQKNQLVSSDQGKPSAYGIYRRIIENQGPKSAAARAVAEAAQPKLNEQIKRALTVHYADTNSKEVNWKTVSLMAKWRQELGGNDSKAAAEGLFCQGMAKLEEGQLAVAIQAFNGALDASPEWAMPRNGKARALFRQGRPNEAEAAYKEAARLDPKWPEPLLNLGNLYMESFNDTDRAEQKYREALAIQPGLSAAHYYLGLVYHDKGPDFFAQSCASLQKAAAAAGARALDAHMLDYARELMQSVCK